MRRPMLGGPPDGGGGRVRRGQPAGTARRRPDRLRRGTTSTSASSASAIATTVASSGLPFAVSKRRTLAGFLSMARANSALVRSCSIRRASSRFTISSIAAGESGDAGSSAEHEVDVGGVERLGIELVRGVDPEPFEHVGVLGVRLIGEGLAKIGVAPHPTAVLRRATALASEAHGVAPAGIGRE